MKSSRMQCLCAAVFFTVSPYTPQRFMDAAKSEVSVANKIAILQNLTRSFPLDHVALRAEEQLVTLLTETNRYEEALGEYRQVIAHRPSPKEPDFQLLDLLLKTGRFAEALRNTSFAVDQVRDFARDEKLLQRRVAALLGQGEYRVARQSVEYWLSYYGGEGIAGSRFESMVRGYLFLRTHLLTLERQHGARGKPMYTAALPDSLEPFSRERNVPLLFYKLLPAHPAGQLHSPLLPGRHESTEYFQALTEQMNSGFDYISGGSFSVDLKDVGTLYVEQGDIDPSELGGNLTTARVYMHTLGPLYRSSQNAFIVLVDYRDNAAEETSYIGDGIILISAKKLQAMIVMHEILQGMGATHQDWDLLQAQGYHFDPDDRGLMTLEDGEITLLGLEEKNRAVLGWPATAVIRLTRDTAALRNSSTLTPS